MPAALILAVCSWAIPGADPYTGTPSAAIMAKTQIPYATRLKLVERVRHRDFDDVVFIDRDSIRSQQHAYDSDISDMAFGTGRRCASVDRSAWEASHVESAMVFCEASWCVARPAVCNNWSIIRRHDPRPPAPAVGPAGRGLVGVDPGQRGGAAFPSAAPVVWEGETGQSIGVVQPDLPVQVVYGTPVGVAVSVPAVPEPSTWVLTLAGVGLLLGRRGAEALEPPRAQPDFEAADEMAEWAVENADVLSRLGVPE